MAFIVAGLPILYITIALGYAYTKAYSKGFFFLTTDPALSSWFGLILAFLIITFSILLGSLVAFQLSRSWLAKAIKSLVFKNHRSFFAIDSILT